MNLTELIRNKRFAPGPGVTEPPPDRGAKLFLFVLQTHFWELITLNLLFLAFCVPIATIPAALCAMNRVLLNLILKGNAFLWSDFFAEFKGSLIKSLPFGIVAAFLFMDAAYALSLSFAENGASIPELALALFLFGLAAVFSGYAFVFIPALPLKNRHIAKNAFIFMLTEWKASLVIVAITVIMAIILLTIAAYSIMIALVPLVFIYFSFGQLVICTAVSQPMKYRILGPPKQ